MVTGRQISIITLIVNGLNVPKKTHRLAEWIKKRPRYMLSTGDLIRRRDTYRLKVRGLNQVLHANGNQKKSGVAILISDKIDFKIKTITRDKEGHYIMIKGSIHEKDITIVNIQHPT